MSDIVEEIKFVLECYEGIRSVKAFTNPLSKAATEITRLRERVKELEEWNRLRGIDIVNLGQQIAAKYAALEPFAKEAERYEPDEGDGDVLCWSSKFSIGNLRRAKAAREA